MQPGLARAVPLGIVGFIAGALIAIVIRLAQGLDPNPAAPYEFVGPTMVLGAFLSAFTFVWGMGAFDPRMNVHGDHAADHHEEPEKPATLLGGSIWVISFWLIIGIVTIAVFAFLPTGPTIRSVHQDDGNPSAIGFVELGKVYVPIQEFIFTATGLDLLPPMSEQLAAVQISQLVVLVAFTAFTLFSLFIVAGMLAWLFGYLQRGKVNPDGTSVPWRGLIFTLIVVSLLSLPLVIPSRVIPMALVVPLFLLPPLLMLIVYRKWYWALFLVAGFALPVLVPNLALTNMPAVMFALIGASLVALVFNLLKGMLPEKTWQLAMLGILSLVTAGVLVYTVSLTRADVWQMMFLLIMSLLSIGLIMPVDFLKGIIPNAMWQRFAAVNWLYLIPHGAGWLANVLRNGLPSFLGQK